jgi:hypothetical protein
MVHLRARTNAGLGKVIASLIAIWHTQATPISHYGT